MVNGMPVHMYTCTYMKLHVEPQILKFNSLFAACSGLLAHNGRELLGSLLPPLVALFWSSTVADIGNRHVTRAALFNKFSIDHETVTTLACEL